MVFYCHYCRPTTVNLLFAAGNYLTLVTNQIFNTLNPLFVSDRIRILMGFFLSGVIAVNPAKKIIFLGRLSLDH